MIEITKIKYQHRDTPHRVNCTDTLGTLEMHCQLTTENGEPMPPDYVKEQIAERIWRAAYGDLHQPLMELQMLARHSVQPQHYDRVMALCDQLNALLTRKSPNDQAQARRTGGVDCK